MSDNNETFASFYSALYVFSHSTENKPDFQKSIDEIKGWVNEQRTKGDEEAINKVGGALKTTVNALHEFKSGDPYDLTCGTLDIISSVAVVADGPHGVAFSALLSCPAPAKSAAGDEAETRTRRSKCVERLRSISGRAVTQSRPHHYHSSTRKILRKMLTWQILCGAVATYCNAYTCFMALLTAAKGKFQEFDKSSDEVRTIDQFINHQKMIVKETLAFLSDKKYLKFNGRLPSERGKLTKYSS
ncbi:hypothetical protein OS493_029752 [Desmophyllum pertusum]|uniref:Uncharacterized protein n=1 Tax=Desmophyllum pertusum TaxID=174260 RepID=A0A9W9YZ87_9CNID|nr:hypothetical protein OS493_029752 [Desmophyllum pertusum]